MRKHGDSAELLAITRGYHVEDHRTEIPVTEALATMIDGYMRQRAQLEQLLQATGAAAAAALGVPEGWLYDQVRKAFVPPSPEMPQVGAGMRQE